MKIYIYICIHMYISIRIYICICQRALTDKIHITQKTGYHAFNIWSDSCVTHESVMSYIWVSHVTHMNESWRTYEWVTSHIWMSHVSHMNESRLTYEWVTSHIWMCHFSHMKNISPWHTGYSGGRIVTWTWFRTCWSYEVRVRACVYGEKGGGESERQRERKEEVSEGPTVVLST